MSSQEVNFRDYHGALALNNIGVLFLEVGCYERALITLKDAVNGMHMVFSEVDEHGTILVDVRKKLRKANKHLHHLETGNDDEADRTFFYEKNHIPSLQRHPGFSGLRPTKIQLSEFTSSFSVKGRDQDLESVVILCNTAVSYFLVSKNVRDANLAQSLIRNSYYVLDMAASIMTTRFACCERSSEEARLMTLGLLVTGTTSQIYNETGRSSDAKAIEERHQRLVDATHLLNESVKST
jgi:hypothetical protein